MSEEQQEQSTGGSLKNVIIGFISTITLGVGGWVTTKLTGGDDEKETPVQQAAPVINIQNNQTQTAGGGTTKVIERERVVEKEKSAPKPKKEADEFKEKPAAW